MSLSSILAKYDDRYAKPGDGVGPVTAVSAVRSQVVAVGYRSGVVSVCSSVSGAMVAHLDGHAQAEITALALSPRRLDIAVGTVASGTVWL